jgi:IS4 transposase
LKKPDGKILRDDEIVLTGTVSFGRYPTRLRRVVALVQVDGVEREMEFLTNHFTWAPSSVAELYRCRWQIEVFFKQIKQTLQLSDFLGNSANAVRWQVWTALLVYVLLRYQVFLSRWGSSFVRLWAVVRSGLWLKLDLVALLESYGIAGGDFRLLGQPEQAFLPGFRPAPVG